jgi:23S rRNA (adenine2030-N6)-methyltransferase
MFSYRHGFHAGNHADVLKHITLIALLQHLTQKDTPLTVIDTHAGAGLYRLDGDYANQSGEADEGILRLLKQKTENETTNAYRAMIAQFNSGNLLSQDTKVYPGSPFIAQKLLRYDDRLRLFEMHPNDFRALEGNVEQLRVNRQVAVKREDGFDGLKAMIPPPKSATGSRRALVLMDPSYEIKSDYQKVELAIQDALKRFATGCYAVWYPIIPRQEAHGLPRRLRTLASQAGKPFLHATLNVGGTGLDMDAVGTFAAHRTGNVSRGLSASGMCIINPPHTLKATLDAALPELVRYLGRGKGQGFTVD